MLTMFRNLLRSKIFGLLFFGLVIAGMALMDIGDIFSGGSGNLVKAGDRSISLQEFDEDVQNRLRDMSRQQKKAVTKADAVDNGVVDQLFAQQVSRIVTLGYGENIGARASTDAVMKSVLEQEAFNNALTGEFDPAVYQDVLERNRFTAREYEQSVRDDLTGNYILGAVGAAIEPPSAYANLLALYEGETREVSILKIDAGDVSELPEPSEEELKKYFEENKSSFGEPERRGVTVLHFSPADFRSTVEITEEMLTEAYETGKQRKYSTDQTRTFVEAYFDTEAAALQALGILAAGGTPDTLENVVSITERTAKQSDLADAEFAKQLFAIPSGAVTEPTSSGNGWLIARVEEVIPGTPFSFENAREDVRVDLAAELAQRTFETAARSLEDLKGEGLTLQEIGERIGAPAISYAPVDARGTTASQDFMVDLAARYPEVLGAVADLFEGEIINDRFDLDDGGIYLGQLDIIVPPSTPEFENVRDRVLAAWKISNRGEAVALFSETLAQGINRGDTTIAEQAQELSKALVKPAAELRRSGQSQELPPIAVTAVFAAKTEGTVVATPSQKQGEYLLISVDLISPPTAELTEVFTPQIKNLLVRQLDSDLASAFSAQLGDAIDVTTNMSAFATYKARNTSQ